MDAKKEENGQFALDHGYLLPGADEPEPPLPHIRIVAKAGVFHAVYVNEELVRCTEIVLTPKGARVAVLPDPALAVVINGEAFLATATVTGTYSFSVEE